MEKPKVNFFLMDVILLIVLIGFIQIVFELKRFAFIIELMLLLVFLLALSVAMYVVYHNKKWGWTILGAVLILLVLNTFLIFLLTGIFDAYYIITVVFSAAGFVLILINLAATEEAEPESSERDEKTRSYYPYIDKMEPKDEAKKEETHAKVEKTFTPGKFVASKKANKFHTAKCDWALRISKPNRIWFNSKEEAEAEGFKADKCVS